MEASIEHNLPSIFLLDKTWTKETINFNEGGFIRLLAPTSINLHPLPSTYSQPSSPLNVIYCHHIGSIYFHWLPYAPTDFHTWYAS